jgi:hypothetical protein
LAIQTQGKSILV